MANSSDKKKLLFNKMQSHFLHIAPHYRELRTTDLRPILFITKKLQNLQRIKAADIGCGAGRYSIRFMERLGEKCHLLCMDGNREMLRQLKTYFTYNHIANFTPIRCDSHKIPLQADSLDCIISFNAVHHFSLPEFLRDASRVLKPSGKLFVYTRLRNQNAKTIWGMHFPYFSERESRLYELDELKAAFEENPSLDIDSVNFFKHNRVYPLEKLVEQAKNHHYSTFKLYRKTEFKNALHKFVQNILTHYKDLDNIAWKDENTLLEIVNK